MKKRKYYIPTIEITKVNTALMQLAGTTSDSNHPNAAPPHRDPAF